MPKHTHARATFAGTVIAESDAAIVVEGNTYFPREAVRAEYLEPCDARSLCPWKGIASYYTVKVGDAKSPGAAWTYRHPAPLARRLNGRFAFRGDVHVTQG